MFRDERLREPLEDYSELFNLSLTLIEELLEETDDLALARDMAVALLQRADYREAVRYLSGPPVSEDDLEVLAEFPRLTGAAVRLNPEGAARVMSTLLATLDRGRFPWIAEDRPPTEAEKSTAAVATASLLAKSRIETRRRMAGKALQEAAVREVLIKVGMTEVPSPRRVPSWEEAPDRGHFYRGDVILGPSRKADLIVRLWDGKLMPIECKVSNSALNSIKRLRNDTAAKAAHWKEEFGRSNTLPVALLAGVFSVRDLAASQEQGLHIFWSHNLAALTNYIEVTRGASG